MTLTLQYLDRPERFKLKIFLTHAAAWALFIFYEMALIYFFSGKWGRIEDALIFYALNIGLFYFHAAIVLRRAFNSPRNPYLLCLLMLPFEIGAYLVLKYLLDYFVESYRLPFNDWSKILHYAIINSWRGLYFLGFSMAYGILERIFVYRRQTAEAERQRLATLVEKAQVEKDLAEIKYATLRQQINPHFLFNTLNFVYNSVYRHSPEASKCIVQLSELMRYSIRQDDVQGTTPLYEEIEQIKNLVEINRMRYDFELYIEVDLPDAPSGLKIIPLLLLTFVENIFKHGHLKDPTRPARIFLTLEPGHDLHFKTFNVKKNRPAPAPATGVGLANALKRLEHTYKGKYQLNINDENEEYNLDLKLQL